MPWKSYVLSNIETVPEQDASLTENLSSFKDSGGSPNSNADPNLDSNTNPNLFQFSPASNPDLNLNLNPDPNLSNRDDNDNDDDSNDDGQLQGDFYNLINVIMAMTHAMHFPKCRVKPKAHKPDLFNGFDLKKLPNFIF